MASGAKTDRAEVAKVLAKLVAGEVLTVTRRNRQARSTRDFLNTLGTIAEHRAGSKSSVTHGRIPGPPMAA